MRPCKRNCCIGGRATPGRSQGWLQALWMPLWKSTSCASAMTRARRAAGGRPALRRWRQLPESCNPCFDGGSCGSSSTQAKNVPRQRQRFNQCSVEGRSEEVLQRNSQLSTRITPSLTRACSVPKEARVKLTTLVLICLGRWVMLLSRPPSTTSPGQKNPRLQLEEWT